MPQTPRKNAIRLSHLENKRIVGVDPSLADTGVCTLAGGEIEQMLNIPTGAKLPLPQRLYTITTVFEEFLVQAQADYLAVEDQFLGSFYVAQAHGIGERKNLKTIQGLSYVKGLVLTLAGKYNIPVIQVNVSQWRTRYLPRIIAPPQSPIRMASAILWF